MTYCDVSKFTGDVYKKLGMKYEGQSVPNYKWVKHTTLGGNKIVEVLSREMCQKHKLMGKGLGHLGDTEAEIMGALKYHRIYDCGNYKFTWQKV